jgi:hypothetical protein
MKGMGGMKKGYGSAGGAKKKTSNKRRAAMAARRGGKAGRKLGKRLRGLK